MSRWWMAVLVVVVVVVDVWVSVWLVVFSKQNLGAIPYTL